MIPHQPESSASGHRTLAHLFAHPRAPIDFISLFVQNAETDRTLAPTPTPSLEGLGRKGEAVRWGAL